ncbi:MAG: crosslink repair DNA glycosylase YcaQ family protein, partial [Actinomycetota bacterium]
MATISLAQARRIALAAQGFADKRPTGPPDVRHLRRVMDRLTILQLDSVNVVCRSHFLPVLARLGPYDRDRLDHYLYHSGEHFEFLSHEASITSQDLQPLLRHRTERTLKSVDRLEAEQPGYLLADGVEVAG